MEREQAGKQGRLGRYELLERLGQGGMGEVWKARDTQLQRYVAIKLLRADLQDDSDFASSFTREAMLVAALRHPNIVQIHDFQQAGTGGENVQAYMVMDYIEGGTLADAIRGTVRKGIFWPAGDIVDLFTAISLALDYAHQRGMIHRDIKPANILLDRSLSTHRTLGEPILTDFGIARWQGSGSTMTGFLGTPLYISPEQAQSQPVNARSDLYSLGIVLYEVLAGLPPFRGNNPFGIMLQHVDEPPPPPALLNPLVTPALSAVILKSIAKDPRERFPSATAMTRALAQAFNLPVPALLDEPREHPAGLVDSNPLQPRSGVAPISSSFAQAASPQPFAPVVSNQPNVRSPFAPETNRMTPAANEAARQTPAVFPSTPQQPSGFPRQQAASEAQIALRPSPPQQDGRAQPGPFARKRLLVVSLSCILVLLLGIGATVVGLHLFHPSGSSTPNSAGGTVGTLLFRSTASPAIGTFDEIQIDIPNVSPPPAGEVYYAWLTQANSEAVVPRWMLHVDNGAIRGVYPGDPPHTDLLASSNRLLITAESASSVPFTQSPSPAQHYYYALITHTATLSPTFSILSCPTNNVDSNNNPCR